MQAMRIQDLLCHIEQSSRYLGTEVNCIRKDHRQVQVRVALAFPDLYEIATSHFGIQILYHQLNKRSDTVAERVFAPGEDMAAQLRKNKISLATLESKTALKDFDILGFSLLYEMNYTNVLYMLDLAGIAFRADQRDHSQPLVIAGGPCCCNPEPVAPFFDAMVVGDGEPVVNAMVERWLEWKKTDGRNRKALLKSWSQIRGVYVPSLYRFEVDPTGHPKLTHTDGHKGRIARSVVPDLDKAAFPTAPIVPFGRPVHDRLRLEVARGCTRGCRFCQAGMIYRPVRERSSDRLLEMAEEALDKTGYEEISLLSLSTGDYRAILPLLENLMARCEKTHTGVSLPSLRVETLTREMMALIQKVRKTGFTIAVEAGSQRLRDVINKNIDEAHVFQTVASAQQLGWKVIKLYFMIGLPTETMADVEAIVDLVSRIRQSAGGGRKGIQLNVSVATFIPKAHTPFQWQGQLPLDEARARIEFLQKSLRRHKIQFKWQHPDLSLLEGLWARGDRRLADLLETAYRKGCRFDGWGDRFDFNAWQSAIEESGISLDWFVTRLRSFDEPLAWDHIDMGVQREYLIYEWENARTAAATMDCRDGDCQDCGACDFDTVLPIVHPEERLFQNEATSKSAVRDTHWRQVAVSFEKTGTARFLGHLELASVFTRAFRRAGITVRYSQGFHPMPKMAFQDALPVGLESLAEWVYIWIDARVGDAHLIEWINAQLPDGIRVIRCRPAPGKAQRKSDWQFEYQVDLSGSIDLKGRIDAFNQSDLFEIVKKSGKSKGRRIDIKPHILSMHAVSETRLQMLLCTYKERNLRPKVVLEAVFGADEKMIRTARVIKKTARPKPA